MVSNMEKTSKRKKRKPLIILVWVVFLFAAGLLSMALQRANIYENSKKDLINQAEIISRQFENIVDRRQDDKTEMVQRDNDNQEQ